MMAVLKAEPMVEKKVDWMVVQTVGWKVESKAA